MNEQGKDVESQEKSTQGAPAWQLLLKQYKWFILAAAAILLILFLLAAFFLTALSARRNQASMTVQLEQLKKQVESSESEREMLEIKNEQLTRRLKRARMGADASEASAVHDASAPAQHASASASAVSSAHSSAASRPAALHASAAQIPHATTQVASQPIAKPVLSATPHAHEVPPTTHSVPTKSAVHATATPRPHSTPTPKAAQPSVEPRSSQSAASGHEAKPSAETTAAPKAKPYIRFGNSNCILKPGQSVEDWKKCLEQGQASPVRK